jgi:hypothetical protein
MASFSRSRSRPTFCAASAGTAPEQGDRNVLLTYLVLVAGLAAIMVGAGKI